MNKRRHWRIVSVSLLTAVSLSGGLPVYAQGQNTGSTPQGSTNTSGKSNQGATKTSVKPSKRAATKNSDGGQRGVQLAESEPAAAISIGPYYALVIGINNYRSLPKLKTAVYDATEVAKLLREHYGFAPPKLLLNPTRKEIILAFNQYRHSLPAKSNLLIYYAGHGQEDQKTKQAYWLPADADLDSDVNWISASTITQEINNIPAQHILVISDSCYSGGLTRSLPPFSIKPGERETYFRKMLESPSRTLMASGRDEPVADDGTAGHSKFAYILLASLLQIDDDKFTAAYLFQTYIQQAVAGEVGSEQVPQYSPILNSGHQWGDFIFSRKKGDQRPSGGLKQTSIGTDVYTALPASSDIGHSKPDIETTYPHDSRPSVGFIDRDAIQDVLSRYSNAYNMRDADALWQICPDLSQQTKLKLNNAFKSASSISMTLRTGMPVIAQDGQNATVKAQFTELYIPRDGSPQPPRSGDITFTLKKIKGVWSIIEMK